MNHDTVFTRTAASIAWCEVWKWVAIGMTGMFFGLLTGQFIPNRNIVTVDQLKVYTDAENAAFSNVNTKLDTITKYIDEQQGAEALREKLSKGNGQ